MLFQDKSKELVLESIRIAKRNANEARKRETAKRIDIYKDNGKIYIENEMKNQFSKYTRDAIKQMIDDSQNITKRIINEISTLYAIEPKRAAILNEKEDDIYKNVLSNIPGLNILMNEVNKYTNLCNHALIYIAPDRKAKKLRLSLITPNFIDVIQDENDKTQPAAIILTNTYIDTAGNTNIYYDYWDIYGVFKRFDEDFNEIQFSDNPGINPYKDPNNPEKTILPFVIFNRNMPISEIWDTTSGEDIISANIQIGVLLTYLNYLLKWQSFKQLYVQNVDFTNIQKEVILDPAFPITIKGDGSAGVLNFQIDIKQIWDIINQKIGAVANNYGMSLNNFKLQGSAQSGFSLKIQKEGLLEARAKQIPLYRLKENELFYKMRIIWNTYFNENINEKAKFYIDYGEFNFQDSPEEERKRWKFDIEMGAKNILDYLMTINPDVKNYEDAEEILKKNVEVNNNMKTSYGIDIDKLVAKVLKEGSLVG